MHQLGLQWPLFLLWESGGGGGDGETIERDLDDGEEEVRLVYCRGRVSLMMPHRDTPLPLSLHRTLTPGLYFGARPFRVRVCHLPRAVPFARKSLNGRIKTQGAVMAGGGALCTGLRGACTCKSLSPLSLLFSLLGGAFSYLCSMSCAECVYVCACVTT